VKEAHETLSSTPGVRFVGNVEGRDLLHGVADVVVTDGFTGNVTLKTLEGALKFFFRTVLGVIGTDDATKRAGEVLLPHLAPLAERFDPDNVGGAMLLGVRGVCVISHGSSSARAIASAIEVAHDLATGGLVDRLTQAVGGG